MKEKFDNSQHQKFINYFNIKKEPSNIELGFYKKTEKYIKFIKWIPGLKMVWIWNSIAMNCADKNSDIDLLIVTTNNSMWLNRILITLIFTILWVRKTPKKHAWKFCLSFFCTIDWLDFNSWKLKNDIYLYFWILYFKPILNIDNTYELFLEKNNIKQTNIKIQNKNSNKFIWFIDTILKNIFLPRTLKHFEEIWKPYWVMINDNMLKFHNWDIRGKIKDTIL